VGEGGGPADVFPGLNAAHLVRSGGFGGRSRRTGAGLGGRLPGYQVAAWASSAWPACRRRRCCLALGKSAGAGGARGFGIL
jgi:hypothetical protein